MAANSAGACGHCCRYMQRDAERPTVLFLDAKNSKSFGGDHNNSRRTGGGQHMLQWQGNRRLCNMGASQMVKLLRSMSLTTQKLPSAIARGICVFSRSYGSYCKQNWRVVVLYEQFF
mmetsp:Transcript_5651/g.35097  ORF Transcript_5651/g.35097 Transcript_5651/m.35097 type:complete len:117 (-) Transcript_5651:1115-1465(-)